MRKLLTRWINRFALVGYSVVHLFGAQGAAQAEVAPELDGPVGPFTESELSLLAARFPHLAALAQADVASFAQAVGAQMATGGPLVAAKLSLEAALGQRLEAAAEVRIRGAIRTVLRELGAGAPSWTALRTVLLDAGFPAETVNDLLQVYFDTLVQLVAAGTLSESMGTVLLQTAELVDEVFEPTS